MSEQRKHNKIAPIQLTKALFKWVIVKLMSVFCLIIPRQNKAVMGCYRNKFADNAKYLYLHWQQVNVIRAIWISGDKQVVERLNAKQMEAYYRWSVKGVFHTLTAKYFVYNSYIGDVNQYLATGACKINLWHGSPLKQIEFDIETGPLHAVFHPQGWQQSLIAYGLYHQQWVKPDVMLAPSPLVQGLFSSAFKLNADQFIQGGNPRTDYYKLYPDSPSRVLAQSKLPPICQGKQLILYAPSWRDSALNDDVNPYQDAIDFKQLNQDLQTQQQILLLRLHPNEAHLVEALGQFDRIVNITHWDDIYGILASIDILISDYSSIYLDALQQPCQLAFFQFDQQHYQTQCRSQYPYTQSLGQVGPILSDFAALQQYLNSQAQQAEAQSQNPNPNPNPNPNQSQTAEQQQRQRYTELFWQYADKNGLLAIDQWLTDPSSKA